jgi:hypothetical protein
MHPGDGGPGHGDDLLELLPLSRLDELNGCIRLPGTGRF